MHWVWIIAGTAIVFLVVREIVLRLRDYFRRAAPTRFPETYLAEWDLESWMSFRPEGHSLAYTLCKPWRIAFYLQKYRLAKYGIAPDELEYFNRQRVLLRAMMRRPLLPADGPSARLAVVGDMMWVRTNWNHFLNPNVLDHLKQFDAVVGNLESPIDPTTPPVEWYKLDAAKFNSEPGLVESFHNPDTGRNVFTALSFANNHAFDRGDDGARHTLALLDRMGIRHTGVRDPADARPAFAMFERNGIRFGMYAVAYGYNEPAYRSTLHFNQVPGLAPWPCRLEDMDLSEISAAVDAMDRAGVDFRILYIHWGHEYELYPTPVQVQLGRKLAALGFDLVAGCHPHVLQPSEICFVNGYEKIAAQQLGPDFEALLPDRGCVIQGRGNHPRKTLVHYSLGNFVTAMLYWETKIGVIQSLRIRKDPATGVTDWDLPGIEFVYNLLAIHNEGRKELTLLAPYVRENLERLRRYYPRHRRIMGYLYRHMLEPMSRQDLSHRACDADFERLREWLDHPTAPAVTPAADRPADDLPHS